MNWRRTWLVLAAALGMLAAAAGAQVEGQAVKGFRLPEFDADGKLKQQLYGETATFLQDGSILLTGLKIEMFRKGEVTARIYSPECAYDPNRKLAASTNHIRIVVQKAVLTGDGFKWNGTNEQFRIDQNVRVTLDADLDADVLAPQPAAGADTPPAAAEESEE